MRGLLYLVILIVVLIGLVHGKKIPKIAIIGGGIGGTSCAFFLKSLFKNDGIYIDLFEAEKIGGRLSVIDFADRRYEEGGCVIHSRNKYMVEFLKKFKLHKKKPPDNYFALYNGKNFVFTQSQWQIKTLFKVLYRYGFGFWKLRNYIENTLRDFERIYDLQKRKVTYTTVGSMLAAMNPKFVNYLTTSAETGFAEEGLSKTVIDEIIMATLRVNYGQNLKVHKMVGSVSVAGTIGDLWSVHGGNAQIPQKLLKASKANLIKDVVTIIRNVESGQIQVATKSDERDNKTRLYDVVIVAAPQTSDYKFKINYENFKEDLRFWGRYHKTVCTFVDSTLDDKYFPKRDSYIDEIFTVKDNVAFNSISKVTPVDYSKDTYKETNVWKIFSQDKMEDKEINAIFTNANHRHQREWLAYPHYETFHRNDSFVLAPNLYHINAIEWAASAMEMSVIGAKNVALLADKYLRSEQGGSVNILTDTQKSPAHDDKEL